MSWRAWFRRRRLEREARRLLDAALLSPEARASTSLGPHHRSRTVALGHEEEDGRITSIRFGILRHPRPYAFSGQSHRVIELYEYEVDAHRIRRLRGHNVTRSEGKDAD